MIQRPRKIKRKNVETWIPKEKYGNKLNPKGRNTLKPESHSKQTGKKEKERNNMNQNRGRKQKSKAYLGKVVFPGFPWKTSKAPWTSVFPAGDQDLGPRTHDPGCGHLRIQPKFGLECSKQFFMFGELWQLAHEFHWIFSSSAPLANTCHQKQGTSQSPNQETRNAQQEKKWLWWSYIAWEMTNNWNSNVRL